MTNVENARNLLGSALTHAPSPSPALIAASAFALAVAHLDECVEAVKKPFGDVGKEFLAEVQKKLKEAQGQP